MQPVCSRMGEFKDTQKIPTNVYDKDRYLKRKMGNSFQQTLPKRQYPNTQTYERCSPIGVKLKRLTISSVDEDGNNQH